MSEINSPSGRALRMLDGVTGERVYAEWLFAHTLSDIERRSQDPENTDRYTLLGLAPLLRKLLADKHNLVHVVRRHSPNVSVSFRMTPYEVEPVDRGGNMRLIFSFGRHGLLPNESSKDLKLEAFLKTPVGQHEDSPVSVLALIHYYAHIEGGVHIGRADDNFQEALLAMSPTLLSRSHGYLDSLAYIAQIVVAGLSELRGSLAPIPD